MNEMKQSLHQCSTVPSELCPLYLTFEIWNQNSSEKKRRRKYKQLKRQHYPYHPLSILKRQRQKCVEHSVNCYKLNFHIRVNHVTSTNLFDYEDNKSPTSFFELWTAIKIKRRPIRASIQLNKCTFVYITVSHKLTTRWIKAPWISCAEKWMNMWMK